MNFLRTTVRVAALGLILLAAGNCSSSKSLTSTTGGTGGSCPTPPAAPADAPKILGAACDPIVPTQCGYPFPSSVYLVTDSTTATGYRIAMPQEAMPHAATVGNLDPAMINGNDGFSPGQTILTHLPGATVTGLPTQDTLATSVTTMSPTILLNADTGELVPHWAELDEELDNEADMDRAFLIRPVVRLADNTRYIVAIRHVVDSSGTALPPTPIFQALRDGTPNCDPSVDARRSLYTDIFAQLQKAGISKTDLQLAWDYRTASQKNNTAWMLAMRDDALQKVGMMGPVYTLFPSAPAQMTPCMANTDCTGSGETCVNGTCLNVATSPSCNNLTVSTVNPAETHNASPSEIGSGNCSQDSPNSHIWRRLFGLMTVPLYTQNPNPSIDSAMMMPTGLNFGSDGLPAANGMAQYEFEVNIPVAATKKAGHPIANGHGLLGDKTEGDGSYLAEIDDAGDFVSIAVDLVGFCQDDNTVLDNVLASDPTQFKSIVGRQHQGLINSLMAMRVMNALAKDPATQFNGQPTIDPSVYYYRGDSQGGIMGTTYMAITTDVKLGVLGEPGMPYSLLLNRSEDFAPFFSILQNVFSKGRDIQMVLGLIQMVWDHTEPDGYAPYIVQNNLPNTPSHQVLIHDNIGDYQVTPLGAHIIARAVGAKQLQPVNREIYGITDAPSPIAGSAIVEWSWGLNPAPETNTPPSNLCPMNAPPKCGDPHDQLRIQPSSIQQEVTWFQTGMVVSTCGSGPCVGTFM
jgi:hypothetical protein